MEIGTRVVDLAQRAPGVVIAHNNATGIDTIDEWWVELDDGRKVWQDESLLVEVPAR